MDDRLPNRMQLREPQLTEQFAGAQNIRPASAKRQPGRQEKFQDLSFLLGCVRLSGSRTLPDLQP